MIASVLIGMVSLVLLVYWFRYSCLLLLASKPADKHAGAVARANRLSFLDVQKALESQAGDGLDSLYSSLDCDYRILTYLLQNACGLDMPSVERQMLILDYRLMRFTYRSLSRTSPGCARAALGEMSRVLAFFSQKIGERVPHYVPAA